ncbi:MAG TPA: sulfatase-like hydrolase/transferase, partial [Candidatus Merdivicinus faecavium]|nr:sulfatase-like hydrolase/transferase [Candidatus Merdivicinus faecavium]
MADNILLITTDQQRFDTIQALGNRSIFTPHLNYMASQGTAYTRCYADCPICVPSRTTIMTGQRGFESGVVSNATHAELMQRATAERRTLPAILTDHGYQTKAMGKMHFDPARAHYGFEEMTLPLDYMREYDGRADTARPKIHGVGECEFEPVLSTVEVKDSITAWTADGAVDFLETRDPLRPFFLWTSFTKPHPPFDPCRDFWALYEGIPMPPAVHGDWSRTAEEAPQGFLAGTYENSNVYLFTPEQIAASRRAYYAMITQIDYSLGRIFGCMRENGLFKNTWVIFTSDHGEMLGDHFMAQKNLFFEGSAHVPLLIMPPQGRGLPVNVRVDSLAEIADIFPTILDIAGIEPPAEAMGRSLLRDPG